MGDLDFTGGSIRVPHVSALAAESVRIKQAYAGPMCTPTRAALLTARYPHNVGLNGALLTSNPYGLSSNHSTVANWLQAASYRTHLVGKWHLGHAKWEYTPTMHGFDEHYGIFGLGVDYFDKTLEGGHDLWHNQKPVYEDRTHATHLWAREAIRVVDSHAVNHADRPLFLYLALTAGHTPLLPSPEHMAPCEHIEQEWRRDFCGLVVGMDEAVHNVTSAFKRNKMWDDTIVVFSSDNGGDPWSGGHNYPFRGVKHSAWEGGMRVPAFIHSKKVFGPLGYDYTAGPLHMTDWAPTLLSLADVPIPETLRIDGIDLSLSLKNNDASPRKETVLVMDSTSKQYAIRNGRWKLLHGHVGDGRLYNEPTGWMNGNNSTLDRLFELLAFGIYGLFGKNWGLITAAFFNIKRIELAQKFGIEPDFDHTAYLFDLDLDPFETNNVAAKHPDIVASLMARIEELKVGLPHQFNWLVKDKDGRVR